MPVMDGYEATSAIRAYEAENDSARMPIVALTAHVEGSGEEWRHSGMDDYVTKPFTINMLAAAISRHLTPSSGALVENADEDSPPVIELGGELQPCEPARVGVDSSVFDKNVLEQLAQMQGSDGDLVERALELFEKHSRAAAKRLVAAVRSGEHSEIASAAHALKSMSVNVGAISLGAACGGVERAAGAPEVLPELMKALRTEYTKAHDALPQILDAYRRSAA